MPPPRWKVVAVVFINNGSQTHPPWHELTATSMRSLETSSMLRITFFSIFTNCESFFARSGPNAPADLWRKVWPRRLVVSALSLAPRGVGVEHTNVGLAKEAAALRRRGWRGRVLNLRRLQESQFCAEACRKVWCLRWARETGAYCMYDACWADVAD